MILKNEYYIILYHNRPLKSIVLRKFISVLAKKTFICYNKKRYIKRIFVGDKMKDTAKKIYGYIADEIISDRFACPCAKVDIYTNPAQLLLDGQKDRMARICSDSKEFRYNKMSDYERFRAFVDALPKMAWSGAYELFFEELSLFFDCEITGAIDVRELWKALCEKMSETILDLDAILKKCSVAVCKNNYLPIICKGGDYSALVDKNLKNLADISDGIAAIDISEIEFSVTDRYHADMACRAYSEGDESQKDIIMSALLYSICEFAKKSDITLYLYIGDNYTSASAIISYFEGRGILPNIRIFASDSICYRVAKELCGVYDIGSSEIRIDLGLVYAEGDTVKSIADKVKNIARVYPVGELAIGGSRSSSPVFAAADALLKKGIAEALAEMCDNEEQAMLCADSIIKNSK